MLRAKGNFALNLDKKKSYSMKFEFAFGGYLSNNSAGLIGRFSRVPLQLGHFIPSTFSAQLLQ